MVPPFLAYYGIIFQNASVLYEAYNQIKLYRSYLMGVRVAEACAFGSGGGGSGALGDWWVFAYFFWFERAK